MCKYILGKSITEGNPNNIKDLESIDKVVWEFISAIYNAYQDSLYTDNSRISFRNKVKSKFSPQVNKALVNNKDKDIVKPIYVSHLSHFIPVKTPKKVNEILKYFKKSNNPQKKSYTQVSSKSQSSNIIRDTLKIKGIFSKLQNNKINQVQ